MNSHQGIDIGSFLPSVLAQAIGYAHRSPHQFVPMTAVALLVFGPTIGCGCIESAFHCSGINIEKQTNTLPYAEVVEQAGVVREVVISATHVACHSQADIGNEIPHTVFLVAEQEVVHIEHHIFMQVPVGKCMVIVFRVDLFGPNTFHLGTQADARRKPLAHRDIKAKGASLATERISTDARSLLRTVSRIEVATGRDIPIRPKRVGAYAVTRARNVRLLRYHSHSQAEKSEC